jgi:hypothetical protein
MHTKHRVSLSAEQIAEAIKRSSTMGGAAKN